MKTSLLIAWFASGLAAWAAQTVNTPAPDKSLPAPTVFHVIQTDANSRVWQRETYEKSPDGHVVPKIHKVTELAAGLNYQDAKGQWQPSQDEIDAYPQGAIAQKGPYSVIFAQNLNSSGSIDLQTPDGRRLRSNILGLFYRDAATGDEVMIGQVQDSIGELVASNQVLYSEAFSGISADVRYTYKKGSFEQDVILRSQLPDPQSFGLNPATTEIEVMTEFLNPPKETLHEHPPLADDEADQDISWGTLSIGPGRAFDLGAPSGRRSHATVTKRYLTVNGRKILVERVPLTGLQSSLQHLPVHSGRLPQKTAAKKLLLPKPLLAQIAAQPMKVASSSPSRQGYVLDYVALNTSQTNFTFQADTTYLVDGVVNLHGTTTFEGGTVIKVDRSGYLNLVSGSTLNCATAAYCPAVFTSINDESVGESVASAGDPYYTGSPGVDDLNTFINLACASPVLSHMRFSYADNAVGTVSSIGSIDFWDCQFVQADTAIVTLNTSVHLHNVLVQETAGDVPVDLFYAGNFTAENVTSDGSGFSPGNNAVVYVDHPTSQTIALTNCLVTAIDPANSLYQVSYDGVSYTESSTPTYQVAGAGSFYLPTNSPYHNAGTTNITPALLTDLATKTTWPPMIYSNLTLAGGTFSPQVPRDGVGNPDLGYHYDPLDYAFGGVNAPTNAVFTFTAGTAMGWFELPGTGGGYGYGLSLPDSASANYNGTVTAPCVQARYSTVQEGGNGSWTDIGVLGSVDAFGSAANVDAIASIINARFTLFAGHAGQPNLGQAYSSDIIFNLTHCMVNSGYASGFVDELCLTNCLLVGATAGVEDFDTTGAALYLQDCTMREGRLISAHFGSSYWPINIRNSAFENVDFSQMFTDGETTDTGVTYCDYNAFVTNQTGCRLPMVGAHDLILTDFDWQTSWLGSYYLPTNSVLINAGSTTADQVGLYHFTTQTSQVKETNSIVDIGYHYVATDGYGNPVDSNGDGIPDYLEDANGDGLVDNGETNWGLGIVTQPVGLTLSQGNNATFTVAAAGVAPLHYQWYFNVTNVLVGATGSSLALTSVQSADTGYYSVVVTNGLGSITSAPALLQVTVILFTNFCDVSSLQLNHDAAATNTSDGCVLGLTPPVAGKWGSAFLKTPFVIGSNTSWSTFFSFRLSKGDPSSAGQDVDSALGADGFVFVLQTRTNNLVGQGGGFMGYGDHPPYGAFTNCSVGVEFDTHNNEDSSDHDGINDPPGDGNHIGIDTNSSVNSLVTQHVTDLFNNTNVWYVWIDYDGSRSNLQIRASETNSRPAAPTLTNIINLSKYWGSTNVYAGFTAGCGYYNQQDILSWQFSVYNPRVTTTNLSVTILSPINQTFPAGSNVLVTAFATNSSPGSPVNWVRFFDGTNSLGYVFSTNNTYQLVWTPTMAGTNVLTAEAANTNGLTAWSAPVTNIVRAAPSITILAPTNGTIFLHFPTNVVIAANATADASTSITNVVLLAGTNSIGTNHIGVSNLYAFTNSFTNGTYILAAVAYDGYGSSSSSSNITITVATNHPPYVNAGAGQTVDLWFTNTAQLAGAVSDDGLPDGTLAVAWSYLGSSTNVLILNSNQPAATAQFGALGVYTLQLSASDSQFATVSNVTITVISNAPPFTYAGPDQIYYNQLSIQLQGVAADDGPFISSWSVLSGPGTVSFVQPNLTNTFATFSALGVYQLKLTATDGQLTSSSNVMITMLESNIVPYSTTNWLYTFDDGTDTRTTNFFYINYDDSGWTNATAPFGVGGTCDILTATLWPGLSYYPYAPHILLRHHFDVGIEATNLGMGLAIDNDAQIFINGILITPTNISSASSFSYQSDDSDDYYHLYQNFYWDSCEKADNLVLYDIATNVWHIGDNIIAVNAYDYGGSAYFDCRVTINSEIPPPLPPTVTNSPPLVVVNQTNFWTTNSISLAGWVFDDDLPSDRSGSYAMWTNVTGTGTVTFDPSAGGTFDKELEMNTVATFSAPGTYVIRFLAYDGEYGASNDVTVVVESPSVAAPVVSLDDPAEDEIDPLEGVIRIAASATGTITNMEFFYSTNFGSSSLVYVIGQVTNSPFIVYWTPTVPGNYSLIAAATDTSGNVGYSAAVSADVLADRSPIVILNQTNLWTTNSVQLQGWVLDDGLPAHGEHYAKWNVVSGPGTVTFNPNPPSSDFTNYLELDATASFDTPGIYLLSLTAYDDQFIASNAVTIIVESATSAPPSVSLIAPANGAVVAPGSAVLVQASAASSLGTVTNVDFFVQTSSGTSLIGKSTNSAFTLNWVPPVPGAYSLMAVATDTSGRVGYSSPVSIQVSTTPPPVAVDDDITVFAGSFNNTLNVLANDYDPNTNAFKIIAVTKPGNAGTATIVNGGGAISYTPAHGFNSTDPGTGTIYPGDGFQYEISNGQGWTAWATVTVRIFATAPPQVQIISPADQATVNAGTVVPIITYVAPSQFVTNVQYYLGAAMIGSVTNGTGGLFTNFWTAVKKDCDCGFTATAYDAFGQIGTSPEIHLNVMPPANGPGGTSIGPVAVFANYFAGTNAPQPFTDLVTIRDGVISLSGQIYHPLGSNDMAWQLGIYSQDGQTLIRDLTPMPMNSDGYHPGKVGNTNVVGIIITNCDLTTLQNGIYTMRLVAEGGYMMTESDVQFILDSSLKIGQFSFSQQDLVIPVNGIPLTVTRTYNSLNPDEGDFGYSWTYALNDMDVQLDEDRSDVPSGSGRTASIRSGGGRDVTLTLPNGQRTTFYSSFEPGGGDSGSLLDVVWHAEPGVTATLTTLHPAQEDGDLGDNTLVAIPYGNLPPYWEGGGGGSTYENYDLPGWILQTLDGTKYYITRGSPRRVTYDDPSNPGVPLTATVYGAPKLTAIVQRNLDTISVAQDGITFNNATNGATRQILFQRNSDGLISSITDPVAQSSGGPPAVKYEYDGFDNLINVERLVDRSSSGSYVTNSFLYTNPNFPHYITSLVNGDGTTVAQNFYDDSGKLIAVQDANGQLTQFVHNLTNNMELVIDRLGHTNIYNYDARGNVIVETDPLGQTTFNSYDLNNNLLSTTDPLNHTTSYAYDGDNNRTKIVDALSHTNSYSYDSLGDLLTQTDPVGNTVASSYDGSGNFIGTTQYDVNNNVIGSSSAAYAGGQLSQTMDANDSVTASFGYDPSSGYLTSSTDARGFTRNFGYDANGNQTSSSYVWVDPGGTSHTVNTSTIYDSQNRVTMAIDADGNTNQTFYDINGKMSYTIDKFGNTNSFIYDSRGNLIKTVYPNGTFTTTVYNGNSQPVLTSDPNQITGTFSAYDADGRVTNTVRLANVVVNIVADPNSPGHMTSVIGSMGTGLSTNSTVYMANGWVQSRTDAAGQTTTYAYWPDGQTESVTDPLIHTTYYQYDAAGRQQSVVDALSHTNRFSYDAAGRLAATLYQNGSYTSNLFNNVGQRIGQVDQTGLLTQFNYDVSGALTNVIKPQVLDTNGNPVTPTWAYAYDQYGRLAVSTDPLSRTNTTRYDAQGRQIGQRLPMGQTNYMLYNPLGQLWKQYDFMGRRTEYVYDRYGRNKARFLFQVGATTPDEAVCYIYNQLNQLSEVVERYGADATTNACDGYAVMVGLPADDSGLGTKLLASVSRNPNISGGATVFALLAMAMILMPARKRRQIMDFSLEIYDEHYELFASLTRNVTEGRRSKRRLRLPAHGWRWATLLALAGIIGNEPGVDQLWTARAQCVYPSNASTPTTRLTYFTYDLEGNLTQVNAPEGVINYGYDLATERHTLTCTANSEIGYGYDQLGRLQTVTVFKRNGAMLTTAEVTTYGYDAVGNRNSISLPNGELTTYQYDSLNRLTNLVHQIGTSTVTNLAAFSYQLNGSGRRTNGVEVLRQEGGTYLTNTLTWQYDGMNRLTNEGSACSTTVYSYANTYVYDQVGNRYQKLRTGSGAETVTYQYNANDELTNETSTVNGTTSYAYDVNGSLTNKVTSGVTVGYSYNVANKLTGVWSGGTLVASYLYNDQGIRVQTTAGGTTNHFLIDASNPTGYAQVLEELVTIGGTPTTSYVLGDETLGQCGTATTAPSYFLYDGHGSTRQMLSSVTGVTSHYNYDAYGVTQGDSTSTPDTTKLYCGEQYDNSLGMYNLRARYYNPTNGRFNQRDTFAGNNDDPQSLHKYLYCHGDPINGIDPTGNDLVEQLAVTFISGILNAFRMTTSFVVKGVAEKSSLIIFGIASGFSAGYLTGLFVEATGHESSPLLLGIISALIGGIKGLLAPLSILTSAVYGFVATAIGSAVYDFVEHGKIDWIKALTAGVIGAAAGIASGVAESLLVGSNVKYAAFDAAGNFVKFMPAEEVIDTLAINGGCFIEDLILAFFGVIPEVAFQHTIGGKSIEPLINHQP